MNFHKLKDSKINTNIYQSINLNPLDKNINLSVDNKQNK